MRVGMMTDEDMLVSMQYHLKFTEHIDFIFFKSWDISDSVGYFKICLLIALLCIVIEAIGLDRWYTSIGRRLLKPKVGVISPVAGALAAPPKSDFRPDLHFLDTTLQLVFKTSTYALMLASMTYNMGIILVICLTLAIANFGFAVLADYLYINSKL